MDWEAGLPIIVAEGVAATTHVPSPAAAAVDGAVADRPGAVSLDDAQVVADWCRRYDVTRDQLMLATTMVGRMPAALHFYLNSHGRPTKIVTDEMRASRAPIRPRDRRRKTVATPVNEVGEAETLEALRLAHSTTERDVRIAAESLHAHPCPATIHAYDAAQARLDEAQSRLAAAERNVATGFILKDGAS